jgi:hypothetical protein
MAAPEKTCFVIAPIGDADSEIRRRSDQILRHLIQPAAKECGYDKAIRADQISEPGIITTQVIQHIIDDALVIADLTGRNPNVFYELAIRHALRRPYVQIIQRGERIPFDVAGLRTIEVDHHDLDSVDAARSEIVRQIQAMQKAGREIESPISVAVDLDLLRRSGNPEQRQLADVMTSLTELNAAVVSVQRLIEPMARREIARRFAEVVPNRAWYQMDDHIVRLLVPIEQKLQAATEDPATQKDHIEQVTSALRFIREMLRARGGEFVDDLPPDSNGRNTPPTS